MSDEDKSKQQLIEELVQLRQHVTNLEAREVEHKQVEAELRKLSYAIEQSPISIVITDLQGKIEYVNSKFITLTGYTHEELIGKKPNILKTGYTPPEVYQKLWETITTGGEWRGEFLNKKKNDDLYWEFARISPITDTNGEVTHYLGSKENITDLKLAEEAQQISEERYRALFENAPLGINVIIPDEKCLMINPALLNMLGYTEEEWVELISGSFYRYTTDQERLFIELEKQGSVHDFICEVRHKNGSFFFVSMSIVPLPLMGKGVILMMVLDITERKAAEKQVIQMILEQERVKILNQIVNDATHDLMTPLSIIKTCLYLSRKAQDEESRNSKLDIIGAQVSRMQDMIKDMITINKLEVATPNNVIFQTVNIKDIIQGQAESRQSIIQEKGHTLTIDLPPHAILLNVNINYMKLAIVKLLDNAIHYTLEGGHILISAESDLDTVTISIQDNGMGISEDVIPHIFERFYRAEQHRPTDSGAGLGLTIVQSIVDLHQGKIEVISTRDKGSKFTISLPVNSF